MGTQIQSFCLLSSPPNRNIIHEEKTQSSITVHTESFIVFRNASQPSRPAEDVSPKKKSVPVKNTPALDKEDILFIDEKIKVKLIGDVDSLPNLRKRKIQLEWIIANGSSSYEKNSARRSLHTLEQTMRKLQNNTVLEEYEKLSTPLLDEYRVLMENTKTQCFIRTLAEGKAEQRKKDLRERYLMVANQYIELDFSIFRKVKRATNMCFSCKSTDFYSMDESTLICCKCGVHKDKVNLNLNFRDTERINLVPRFNYTRRGHMNEALQKFQGKQNTTIPSKVMGTIRTEMSKNNITSVNLTKRHIYLFLSQNGWGDHYENINLIHHILTGKPCPDISQYETEILKMSDQIERVYVIVKEDDRKNSLNVYYKLWKICEVLCLKMNREDFSFLKTTLKVKEHDDICEIIFRHLGWYFEETSL